MAIFTVGARLHDYGKGTPDELFGKVSADGFACVQLAYKKCVPGVASYADVTPRLVQNTLEAQKKHNIAVAVLGTYVELAIADEVQRSGFQKPAGRVQGAERGLHWHRDYRHAQAARRHHPRARPIYALQKPGNHSAGSRAPWRDRCH